MYWLKAECFALLLSGTIKHPALFSRENAQNTADGILTTARSTRPKGKIISILRALTSSYQAVARYINRSAMQQELYILT